MNKKYVALLMLFVLLYNPLAKSDVHNSMVPKIIKKVHKRKTQKKKEQQVCTNSLAICQIDNNRLKTEKMQMEDERDDAKKRMVKNKGASLNDIIGYAFIGLLVGILVGAKITERK